ncbi:hypothetical protein PLICRDRAFT_37620 [Plicaturopsis crispa FD-325 SS-3]|nr:hypothetical protein PLICRDRAFT_37620 [Plicaturopsis crispa FD-325 SS-3]
MSSSIQVETKYLPSSDSSLPPLALRVTRLESSVMLWIGTTDESPEDVHKAPLQGMLSRDWACAMPPATSGIPAPATSLFRSSGSDSAVSMAQRLARRFGKQVFLSVDVPPNFLSMGQGPKLLMEVEKGLVQTLKEMETKTC